MSKRATTRQKSVSLSEEALFFRLKDRGHSQYKLHRISKAGSKVDSIVLHLEKKEGSEYKLSGITFNPTPPPPKSSGPWSATITELLLLVLVILTFGFALVLKKQVDTSESYIHCVFKPIDYFMMQQDET